MNQFERYGSLIVISGPSGVGKSTLVKEVQKVLDDLKFSISCTTRAPRPGEEHGREYYFLSKEEFEEILRKADIITLHCPLNQESKGMFHKEVFAKCEKKPYFVNILF